MNPFQDRIRNILDSFINLPQRFKGYEPILKVGLLSNDEISTFEQNIIEGKNVNLEYMKKICDAFPDIINYIFTNNAKKLWNYIKQYPLSVNYTEELWKQMSLYICKKKINIKSVCDIDKNIIMNCILSINNKFNSNQLKYINNFHILFYFIETLELNNNDEQTINILTENIYTLDRYKNILFDTLEHVIKISNEDINTGMYIPTNYEFRGLSINMELKILYFLLKIIDIDRDDFDSSQYKCLETCLQSSYYNIYLKRDILKMHIKDKQVYINSILNFNDQYMANTMSNALFTELDKLYNIENEINNYLNNYIVNDNLNYIFTKCIINKKITNNILTSISKFYGEHKSYFNNDIADFTIEIINSKTITSNPHIRGQFLKNAVYNDNNCNIYNDLMTKACINFFNDIELTKDDSIDYEKGSIRKEVYTYFINNFNEDKIKVIDSYKLKMFINFIIRDILSCLEYLKTELDVIMSTVDYVALQKYISIININLNYISDAVDILIKFIELKDYNEELFSSEIIIRLRTSVAESMYLYDKFVTNESNKKLITEIENNLYTKFNIYNPCIKIFTLLSKVIKDEESAQILFSKGNIDKDEYNRIYELLKDKYSNLPKVNMELITNENNNDIEYPDELLDQITYEPLIDPVIIPNTDVITNRNTIIQYIMTDGINPYTRDSLSIEDINNCNEKEENKKIIKNIIKKINEFKK